MGLTEFCKVGTFRGKIVHFMNSKIYLPFIAKGKRNYEIKHKLILLISYFFMKNNTAHVWKVILISNVIFA